MSRAEASESDGEDPEEQSPDLSQGSLIPMSTPAVDAELERLYRRGERVALEELLLRHAGRLRGYLRVRLGDRLGDARAREEVVMSAVRRAARNADQAPRPAQQAAGGVALWLWRTGVEEAWSRLRASGDGQPGPPDPAQVLQEFVDSPDEPLPQLDDGWAGSTELLVARLQNDEELAWAQLYGRFSKPLQALIRKHLPDSLRAHLATEDLFQSAMLRVRDNIGRFESRGPGSFKAWLTRVILNLIYSKARKGASLPPELDRRQPVTDLLDPASAPAEEAELAERLAHLTLAIAALPERHQEVLLLFLDERLNTAQIAERLGISERSARRIRAEAVAAVERWTRE